MTDLTKLSAIAAIEWFEASKLDAGEIKVLVQRGVVDTERIAKILHTDLDVEELEAVPDLEPTDENLELLLTVGSEIMLNDRENAQDWAKVIEDFGIDEDVQHFRTAGRSPSFARKVLELFNREEARYEFDSYDLTLPYAEIADRLASGLTEHVLGRWAQLDVDVAAAQIYETDGLSADDAFRLRENFGVQRADWLRFKELPGQWLGHGAGTHVGFPMPVNWATIDDLLDLFRRGYTKGTPWAAKLPDSGWYGGMSFSLDQARALADAKLTTEDIARMWAAGSTSGRRRIENEPPALLPYRVASNQAGLDDATIADLIELHKLGIRSSHLNDYRWSGAHSLASIKQAVAEGINPARVKELRNNFGWAKWTGQPKRIHDMIALFAIHNKNSGN